MKIHWLASCWSQIVFKMRKQWRTRRAAERLLRRQRRRSSGMVPTEPLESRMLLTSPKVTSQPDDSTVTSGSTASFSAAASGQPTPTVQWQMSTDGTTWGDISNATSTTYSFTTADADNGKQYHAIFTNTSGSATTNSATLTVQAAGQPSLPYCNCLAM